MKEGIHKRSGVSPRPTTPKQNIRPLGQKHKSRLYTMARAEWYVNGAGEVFDLKGLDKSRGQPVSPIFRMQDIAKMVFTWANACEDVRLIEELETTGWIRTRGKTAREVASRFK